jgi:sn-glycerol 3-phosphate transport system substrate-binding protein
MTKQIDRRSLFKGAAGAGAGLAAVGSIGIASGRSSTYTAPALIQATGSPVEVSYWTAFGSGVNGEAQTAVIQKFNQAQGDVRVVAQPLESYEDVAAQLISGLQTGDFPDIALLSDVWWFRFYLAEALADLTPLLSAEAAPEDYVDSLYREYHRAGGQYAIPFARSTPLFYYNADAVEKSGVSPDAFGKWSTFREAAPDLISGSGLEAAFAFGNAASYGAWVLHGAVWAFDGRYSDEDFNILVTEEGCVNAGEFMREFVSSGNAITVDDPVTDFASGVSVAIMGSTGSLGQIRSTANFAFKTAFLPEELKFGCPTGGAGLSIMAGAPEERKAAAMQFIEFCTSTEETTIWSQATGYMPVRTSAIESPEEQAYLEENPNARTAVEQLPLTQPQDTARVFIPNGDQILGRGWEQILVNNRPAAEVWAEVQAELEPEAQAVLEQVQALEGE